MTGPCTCGLTGQKKMALGPRKLELQAVVSCSMWVLGKEPRSSTRAVRFLNQWAISPAQLSPFIQSGTPSQWYTAAHLQGESSLLSKHPPTHKCVSHVIPHPSKVTMKLAHSSSVLNSHLKDNRIKQDICHHQPMQPSIQSNKHTHHFHKQN